MWNNKATYSSRFPSQNGVAERGMRTRAEQAHALLISSRLPCFLWEEAMKHSTWLQNQMPAQALNGKTPFEMKLGRKPNLGHIHEFGAAAYVKDLEARKLDSWALVGCFVGYDIETKGYQIYWPTKRSITVERNVIFNENDVHTTDNLTIIQDDTLAEGERTKNIQSIPKNSGNVEDTEVQSENESQSKSDAEETNDKPQSSNTIPFPSKTTENVDVVPETDAETLPQAYR